MLTLRPEQAAEWLRVVDRSVQHDFYHLPGYHALAEEQGLGKAHLFVHTQGDYQIALPLLLRPIGNSLEPKAGGWQDATSVYGYAGPVMSHHRMPAEVIHEFQGALEMTLRGQGVVAVFSRLHPLINQAAPLQGLGEISPVGVTVSIDLTLPGQTQWALFRDNHRRGILKLQRQGITCVEDEDLRYLASFVGLYQETMRRVSAEELYFFGTEYFGKLIDQLSSAQSRLFVVLEAGEVIAGALIVGCAGIVQYHLGGTRDESLKLAPMKLLFDTVRRWAVEREWKVFHLGGGVGAQEDSLFHFKAGFSDRRHGFSCWRWVVDPAAYQALCTEAARQRREAGCAASPAGFFPEYRSPRVPAEPLLTPAA